MSDHKHEENQPAHMSVPEVPDRSLAEALEYATKTHEYIKHLNQLTDQRANYLIVTSSILIAALLNIGIKPEGEPWNSLKYWAFVLMTGSIIVSILIAVRAILPKTFDAESPLHTSAIAMMPLDEYICRGERVTIHDSLNFILRENHVVSKIVEFKSKLVRLSASSLYCGIVVGVLYWIVTSVIRYHQ
jgi:hypothetical protein